MLLSTFWQVLARFSRKHFARCTWPDHCFRWSKDAPSKSKSASRKSAFTKSWFAFSKSAFAKSSFARLVCARPYCTTVNVCNSLKHLNKLIFSYSTRIKKINILNSYPPQSRVEGLNVMKTLYWRLEGCRPITPDSPSQGRMKWNEMKWKEINEMNVEKLRNEISSRGQREKPRGNPTYTPFRPPRSSHGVTDKRTRTSAQRWEASI